MSRREGIPGHEARDWFLIAVDRKLGREIEVTTLPALHHVQIAIPKGGEREARRFYGDVLGLRGVPKPASLQGRGGVWFDTGTVPLHLGVDPSFASATKAHVAFEVDELVSFRQRLVAAGCIAGNDEPLPGVSRSYTSDPFGNRVELLSPPASGPSF